jgi:hypothetical protein
MVVSVRTGPEPAAAASDATVLVAARETPAPPPAATLPPAPAPSPEPTPAPMVEPPLDPQEPARIALSVEHGFKSGRLKIWVDDSLVLERTLGVTRTKNLLFIKRRRGTFAEVLEVPPGERWLRVEAVADGETRRGELRAVLKSDETRLLEVKLGGKVELEWQS